MNRLKGLYVVLLIALVGVVAMSCSKKGQATQTERTVAVNAQVVAQTDENLASTYTGSLEGEQQAILYAKLAEAVEKVHVREGQPVKANQVIISLDKTGPSARYDETMSVFRNAEKNFSKMENLYKEGAISESQYDAAKTQYEVAKSNFEAVSRLVDIRTPIAGTVTSLSVRAGDFVNVGQQLATVATPGRLRVKFPVNADQIGTIQQGADVQVVSDVVSDTAHGTIVAIAESADPMTRSFQVEARLDNDSTLFKPGMFVKIHVTQQKLPGVMAVPREAILNLDNKDIAFVVVNGVAKKREVTLGPELEGRVIVQSGLQPGDTLVTLGQSYLDDGYKVTISSMMAEG